MKTEEEMLMSILSNGETVFYEGFTYGMSESGALVAGYGGRFIEIDCDMRGFSAMAKGIGMDELWLRCCAMSLKKKKSRTSASSVASGEV